MQFKIVNSIAEIGRERWQKIYSGDSPFLRFEFLHAQEKHGCVGEHVGWIPYHAVVEELSSGELLGIMPLYIKTNSYGELVFDWAWANAYERTGREYYPKLVSAIPYTPVTGERMLINPSANKKSVEKKLIQGILHEAQSLNISSIHCLFPEHDLCHVFNNHKFETRMACQFHWHNEGYERFDEFLSTLTSRKRKNIKKERARVEAQGFHFEVLQGNEIEDKLWPIIYEFYKKTFDEKGGYATFTLPFFKSISKSMGEQLLVILAYNGEQTVASAIFYKDRHHLYGRHWGCLDQFDSLHFEVCYYMGIEYAIKHGIKHFEPGAQGEHKISRGFLPKLTWSSHWIKDPEFSLVISQFIERERIYMKDYVQELQKHSPFKVIENPHEKKL